MLISIKTCRLYGILDAGYARPESMPRLLQQMILGGVDIVQLRAKSHDVDLVESMLRSVLPIARDAGIPLIVNDFPELADLADGVHVGQDDASVVSVRAAQAPAGLVGKSTHSIDQAVAAEKEEADYIGFGPLFPTPTKLGRPGIGTDGIATVHQLVKIPIFCIGGIKLSNLDAVLSAGARRIVIVSEMLQSANLTDYARACREKLAAFPLDALPDA
jgi:thiamine-phosphate pyrophosphorylase